MWDNPRVLNIASNVLFAAAFALAAYGAVVMLMRSPAFPLRTISVEGELHHVVRADVVNALQGRMRGTFFNVDLDVVRALFETIPWVRHAQVRRLWPDRIEVQLEEHVALARWKQEGRLVNTYGEVFSGRGDASLPLFSGPDGSAAEMTRRYAEFRRVLEPLALEPREVLLNSRYAWQLKLPSGLSVQLGRDSEREGISARLARLVSAYPQTLGKFTQKIEYVDLRYPNGFALRLPESAQTKSKNGKRGRT